MTEKERRLKSRAETIYRSLMELRKRTDDERVKHAKSFIHRYIESFNQTEPKKP